MGEQRRSFVSLALALTLALIPMGCSASGCDDFATTSAPTAVGESGDVTISIVNRGWSTLDFAGALWTSDDPIPLSTDRDLTLPGTATLIEADLDESAEIVTGVVSVDVGQLGDPILFTGPIGCD